MFKSETIAELSKALASAQNQMTHAIKDATNPHFKSKYADLAAIVESIRGPLGKNGLSYSQLCDFTESGGLIVETILMHSSGEWIGGKLFMPVPQQTPQGIGSAITYAKRYSLAAIVGIASDDDDGEAAMGRGGNKPTPTNPAYENDSFEAEPVKASKQELTDLSNALKEYGYDAVPARENFVRKHAAGKKPADLTSGDITMLLAIISDRMNSGKGA